MNRNKPGCHRASPRVRLALGLALLVAAGVAAGAPRELRVCADPDNLPFSNDKLEGFENRIAALIAQDLGASVRYAWHPQTRGFIRETLKAGACDLVIGVPAGYELVLATRPYYSASYVFVYRTSRNLQLRSFDDPVLRDLRIGLHAFGDDGANAPPAHALARRGIVSNVVGFTILNTADDPPGKIIDAVAAGDIDVAIVWGPYAGFFAKRQPVAMEIVPVPAGTDRAAVPFVYDVSLGVRRGDESLKREMEGVLDRRQGDIRKILDDYGIPVVNVPRPSTLTGRDTLALPGPT